MVTFFSTVADQGLDLVIAAKEAGHVPVIVILPDLALGPDPVPGLVHDLVLIPRVGLPLGTAQRMDHALEKRLGRDQLTERTVIVVVAVGPHQRRDVTDHVAGRVSERDLLL